MFSEFDSEKSYSLPVYAFSVKIFCQAKIWAESAGPKLASHPCHE